MATVVVRSRMCPRPPGSRTERSSRPAGPATLRQTVPTGFSGVPPPGPAMPVMPIPYCAPKRARAPSASAAATSGETAPWRSISAGGTAASATLASLE